MEDLRRIVPDHLVTLLPCTIANIDILPVGRGIYFIESADFVPDRFSEYSASA